jgi:hypothetical protein
MRDGPWAGRPATIPMHRLGFHVVARTLQALEGADVAADPGEAKARDVGLPPVNRAARLRSKDGQP